MIKIKKYSLQEAMKRLYDGETLYNSKQGLEIMYNGKPDNRKTSFPYDIIVSKGGEYDHGYNDKFINEYIRYHGLLANSSLYTENSIFEFKKDFDCIHSRIIPTFRPMTKFEMMGWANSDESKSWLVRVINKGDNKCSRWLLPQQLRYDDFEGKPPYTNNFLFYERVKLLPDHSDIDKSTKNNFEIEDTNYQFYMLNDKKPEKHKDNGYER
jgi:hypothetical protein